MSNAKNIKIVLEKEKELSLEFLKEIFYYKENEIYYNKDTKHKRKHEIVKGLTKSGFYVRIAIFKNKKQYSMSFHRVKFMLKNDRYIKEDFIIDHIDRDKRNNSISNLRELNVRYNALNKDRTSNKYYIYMKNPNLKKRYRSIISYHCQKIYNGYYYTALEATTASIQKMEELAEMDSINLEKLYIK